MKHWRIIASLFVCLTWLASSADAAVACASANWAQNQSSASTTIALTFPSATTAGQTKVIGVFNRSNTTNVISSVVGSVDATGWVVIQGPTTVEAFTDGVMWSIYRPNATAGTETVTITFDGAINAGIVGGSCTGMAAASLDASATPTQFVGNTTNWDSNTVSATQAGGIIAFTATGTNSITFTIDGAGESQLNCGTAGQRICAFFEPYASAGSYGVELTSSSSIQGSILVSAFKEPAAAGGCTGGLLLLGAGKCDDE